MTRKRRSTAGKATAAFAHGSVFDAHQHPDATHSTNPIENRKLDHTGAPISAAAAAIALQLFECIGQVYGFLKKQKRECSHAALTLCIPPVLLSSLPLLLAAAPHVITFGSPKRPTAASAQADLYDPTSAAAAPPCSFLRLAAGPLSSSSTL